MKLTSTKLQENEYLCKNKTVGEAVVRKQENKKYKRKRVPRFCIMDEQKQKVCNIT